MTFSVLPTNKSLLSATIKITIFDSQPSTLELLTNKTCHLNSNSATYLYQGRVSEERGSNIITTPLLNAPHRTVATSQRGKESWWHWLLYKHMAKIKRRKRTRSYQVFLSLVLQIRLQEQQEHYIREMIRDKMMFKRSSNKLNFKTEILQSLNSLTKLWLMNFANGSRQIIT